MNINISFTIPELTYLTFLKPTLEEELKRSDIFYLGTSSQMQSDFLQFTNKTFKNHSFTERDLSLNTIIKSLWDKINTIQSSKVANQLTKDLHGKQPGTGYYFSKSQIEILHAIYLCTETLLYKKMKSEQSSSTQKP